MFKSLDSAEPPHYSPEPTKGSVLPTSEAPSSTKNIEPPQTPESTFRRVTELEQEVTKLKQDNARLTQDNTELKQKIAENERRFEEQNQQLEKSLERLKILEETLENLLGEKSQLQEMVAALKEEVRELSYDSNTGLKIRTLFYKGLKPLTTEHLSSALGQDSKAWENERFEDFSGRILEAHPETFESVPLSILMGDIAYLALANEAGHSMGDKLLKETGQVARAFMEQHPETAECFRYGGDEIAGKLLSNKGEGAALAAELKQKMESIEFSYFAARGLKPNLGIDIGVSHFSEGLAAFQELIKSINRHNLEATPDEQFTILPQERHRMFTDLWVAIADTKSLLYKADTRIAMLKQYKKDEPGIYKKIVDSLRKGSFGATDEELDRLPDEDQETIRRFIINKSREKRAQKQGQNTNWHNEESKRDLIRQALFDEVVDEMLSEAFIQEISQQA